MNYFWSVLALSIIIAFVILPRHCTVCNNMSLYCGGAGLVSEGMDTLRKTTMKNYPYNYATHPPTGRAFNKAIDDYYESIGYNDTIVTNNEYLIEDHSQISAFNACA